MKKIILAMSLLITLSAHAFVPRIHVQVNPLEISFQIVNTYNRPIICSGTVYGRTTYGNTLNSWVNGLVIWPGQYQVAYIYSNYRNQFRNGWANVNCHWR